MLVNTQRLFVHLLRTLRTDVICDIGSMDGADALRFRAARPAASIYAFEAHPDNASRMQADIRLQNSGITVMPLAITDHDGDADFFMISAVQGDGGWRGKSSLHRRIAGAEALTVTRVATARLDTVLAGRLSRDTRLALWIDTEGKAYEVLKGAADVLGQVQLAHIEVETLPCISAQQRFYPEVKALLLAHGFIEIATDQAVHRPQFNALFVRDGMPAGARSRVRLWLIQGRVRRILVNAVRRFSPGIVRWYVHRWRR